MKDGGSTDGTVDILSSYDDAFYWTSIADAGPADAINQGFSNISGDILFWLNADDILYPNIFEKVIKVFELSEDVDVVYGNANYVDENGCIIDTYPVEPWNWLRMQQTCIISQPAAFFRRSIFEKYGPLNTKTRIMDYDFWLRLGLNKAKFLYIPETFASMRRHNMAFSVAQRLELHRQTNDITRALLGYTPASWLTGWSCAYVEKRGIRPGSALHVLLGKILLPLTASLRWNKSFRGDLIKHIFINCLNAAKKRTFTPNKF